MSTINRMFVLFAAIALLAPGLLSAQAVPDSVSYQGKLTTSDGIAVADGTHPIQFKLYTAASGGTAFWASNVVNVQTTGGIFTTQIGPLSATDLAGKSDVHLEVLAGDPLETLTPRVKFLSVPYALKASGLQISTDAAEGKVLTSDASGNATWQNSGLALPYHGNISTDLPALRISNEGTGDAIIGEAGPGGVGIRGYSLGNTGVAGQFEVSSSLNPYASLYSFTQGTGEAAIFRILNASNSNAAVSAQTSGSGPAIKGIAGIGLAAEFVGKVKASGLQIVPGASSGKVLKSDDYGNATWQDAGSYTAGSGLTLSGSEFSIADLSVGTGMLASGAVTPAKISASGAISGQALVSNGTSVLWGNPIASGLNLPYSGSAGSASNALSVTNTGSGRAGSFSISNASNSSDALRAETNGTGAAISGIALGDNSNAGFFSVSSAASSRVALGAENSGSAAALFGQAWGTGMGVWGITTVSTGTGGRFDIMNSSNPNNTLTSYTGGTGKAAHFEVTNAANSSPAVHAQTNGTGPAIKGLAGTGLAGEFVGKLKTDTLQVATGASSGKVLTSDASGNATWQTPSSYTAGAGLSLSGSQLSIANLGVTTAMLADTSVTNAKLGASAVTPAKISSSGAASGQSLMYNGTSVLWGNPTASSLALPWSGSVNSSSPTLSVINTGVGWAGYFRIINSSSTNTALCAVTDGALGSCAIQGRAESDSSNAGYFVNYRTTSSAAVLEASSFGSGAALLAYASGTGPCVWGRTLSSTTSSGAKFEIDSSLNPNTALYSLTNGTGKSAHIQTLNSGSTSPTLHVQTNSMGDGIKISSTNASNNASGIYIEKYGTGAAIAPSALGTGTAVSAYTSSGRAGVFTIAGSTNNNHGVYITHAGSGTALVARAENSGWAAKFHGDGANSAGVYITAPSGSIGLTVAGGTKNAVVATSDGARLMYAEEATEVWFTDYGFGRLENGRATISIDPKFAETVTLTEPYHVFVQLNDPESEGVAVTNKTATGFDVVELRHGVSNAEFSYRIVAKRKGYEHDRMERSPSADNDPNLYPR